MTYKELLLFIYLYIAYSDFNLKEVEIKVIKKKLSPYFQDNKEENIDTLFNKLLNYSNTLHKTEVEDIIEREFSRLKENKLNVEQFLSDLEEIIESDGIVYDTEVVSLNKVKKLIV